MDGLVEFFKNLGTGRLIALMGILAVLGGFFSYISHRLSTPHMALLFTELNQGDAAKVVNKIEGMGIPYDMRNDGTAIYVPDDQVVRLRMRLAEEGLPTGNVIGNEIFDRQDQWGVTSFMQDINQIRALEGELARTIGTIKQVSSARVHLVIPKKALFARDNIDPSASIILKLRNNSKLTESQVQAIQHLVASAVPGLNNSAISIVDDQGHLLARGDQEGEISGRISSMEEMRIGHENRLSKAIESLLERTLGPGRVKAEVNVEIDFDQVTENAETFDPEGQVVRSAQTSEDGSNATENANPTVTVQNNLPAPPKGQAAAPKSANQSKKNEETINYEISKTVKSRVKELGGIKRLSVAVVVDGNYTKTDQGKEEYAARSKEEMDQITSLVKSAIGFKADRGDTVEVKNMRFAMPDIVAGMEENKLIMGMTKGELIHIGSNALLVIAALLVSLLVLKPLISQLFALIAPAVAEGITNTVNTVTNNVISNTSTAANNATNTTTSATGGEAPMANPPFNGEGADNEQMMNINKVDGQMKVASVAKVGELVQSNPDQAANMVRNWMYQE